MPKKRVWLLDLAALLFCIIFLLACNAKETNTSQTESENASRTPVWNFSFSRPNDLTLQYESEDHIRFCFENELRTRYNRCLYFSKVGHFHLDDVQTILHIGKSGTFHYINREFSVGSIGTEYKLDGFLKYKDETVLITATAQAGAGFDDATWAIPIIKTIHR